MDLLAIPDILSRNWGHLLKFLPFSMGQLETLTETMRFSCTMFPVGAQMRWSAKENREHVNEMYFVPITREIVRSETVRVPLLVGEQKH